MAEPDERRNEALVARAQAFDLWASRWAGLYDLAISLAIGRRLRKAIAHIKGPRVLEVSFGTGYLLCQYASRFDTTGVDYNPRMLEMARRRLSARGVQARLLQGDAHALPFPDNTFDSLVNTDAFTLYRDPQRAMSEFHRVLAPGGRLVLMEYNYPKDRNWLGMKLMAVPRAIGMPMRDFDGLLRGVGFSYEDHSVGMAGLLHMYVATK
jgi:ubiquinone/menaquinone biosynthesis C-methylase UbiE